eukprot:14320253-Ditylum_brightwellii.AAC.1
MKVRTQQEEEDAIEAGEIPRRSVAMKWFCCCLRWKLRMIMRFLGFLVLLNPFFGCIIAWMLLYQSDKTESFIVLGLEGGSLMLHFASVYLEGAIIDCCTFIFHAIVPLDRVFAFNGCKLCVDGTPPVDGICYLKNGTNITLDVTQ